MIPGELKIINNDIEYNLNRQKIIVTVSNYGDRPIQVGSHFHFYEVNSFLKFNRSITLGFRLDIPAGTSVRFEPGQFRDVCLINYLGKCQVYGFRQFIINHNKK